jgi:hypothetical protein
MTNQQIAKVYKQAGFEVKLSNNSVVIGLNRPISVMEVQAVMDIPGEVIKKQRNEVVIFGEDS